MENDFKVQQNIKYKQIENGDLNPSVNRAIVKIAEKNGYIRHRTYKKMLSAEGGNYLGVLYEIDIKGETTEGSREETNIFVKQVIPNSDSIKLLSVSEIYSREIFVYTELTKIFTELENKANVPMKNRLKFVKIYNYNFDVIMLENISKQGFKTYGRTEVMKLNYAKLCLENLAKIHGLGFAIERRMPKYFEDKIKSLKHPVNIDSTYDIFMTNIYRLSSKNLSPELRIKTDKWWNTALKDYPKYFQGTMTEVNCLCHGDFKMNNIMYNEIEGEIIEVLPIDYQLTHYGSPILDLIFFLYTGTDQQFRRKHLEHLKQHYYVSLEKYLKYFDILIDDVYPRQMFEKDFEKCLDHALVTCIWLLPLAMISQDKTLDLGDYDTLHLSIKFDDRYYDRLQGIFDDCFKWDI